MERVHRPPPRVDDGREKLQHRTNTAGSGAPEWASGTRGASRYECHSAVGASPWPVSARHAESCELTLAWVRSTRSTQSPLVRRIIVRVGTQLSTDARTSASERSSRCFPSTGSSRQGAAEVSPPPRSPTCGRSARPLSAAAGVVRNAYRCGGRRIATRLERGEPRLEPRALGHERRDVRGCVRGRIGHSCLRWSSGVGHPGYGPASPERPRAATRAAT